jgi:hypothetical protein
MSDLHETYRGVEIFRNFTSIHGTGRRLKAQRGWQLHLSGYGRLGWQPSLADAKRLIDGLHEEAAPAVARALKLATATGLERHLRAQLPHAEWHDKVIHYCDGDMVQNYYLTLHLPVPVDAADKSVEAAFERFLAQTNA